MIVWTAGLLGLVANGLMLLVTAELFDGLTIDTTWEAILAALLMTVVGIIVSIWQSIDDDAVWQRRTVRRMVNRLEPPPPSQTGASQTGILHGNNHNMPAFRWYDKEAGKVFTSNRPRDAAEIEARQSHGHGLLVDGGVSRSNVFSSDSTDSAITFSTLLDKSKHSHHAANYFLSDPYAVSRLIVLTFADAWREVVDRRRTRRAGAEPRLERGGIYPLIEDNVDIAVPEMSSEGWGNLNGALTEAVRDKDSRIGKVLAVATRNRIVDGDVVLGPAFADEKAQAGGTDTTAESDVIVLASGNLGLISFTDIEGRASMEQLGTRFPSLIAGLAEHPGIGFVLVDAETLSGLVIGGGAIHYLSDDHVEGAGPLIGFHGGMGGNLLTKRVAHLRRRPPPSVEVVPAAHKQPRGPHSRVTAEPVGYVVNGAGRRIYFPGDTDLFDAMAELGNIDVALLPIWGWGSTLGTGHLNPTRAAAATGLIHPGITVAIHWGTYAPEDGRRSLPTWFDNPPDQFEEALADAGLVHHLHLLQPGESVSVP